MSDSSLPPRHVTPRRPVFGFRQIFIYSVAIACVFGCVGYALIKFREQARAAREAERSAGQRPLVPGAGKSRSGNSESTAVDGPVGIDNMQLLGEELQREEQRQLVLLRLDQVIERGDRILTAVEELQEVIHSAQKTNGDLLTGESGKRVAADRKLVEQYHAIMSKSDLETKPGERFRVQVEALLSPVRRAKAGNLSAYTPSEELLRGLGDIEGRVIEATEAWKERDRRLASLARMGSATAPADGPTLGAALEALKEEWATERNRLEVERVAEARREEDEANAELAAKVVAEKAAAEREAKQAVAKAEEESIRALGQVQAEAIARATREKLQQADADAAAAAAQARRAELERQFKVDLPEVQRLLRPLITVGSTQPGRFGVFETTTTKGPVSLGGLAGAGALKNTIEGQKRLYFIVGSRSNDRELGGFPGYIGSEQDWRTKHQIIQRAQDLLIRYGDLMVEKKMLVP